MLDATVLQILGRFEPRDIARLESQGALMPRAKLVDFAALGRVRPRSVHDRGAKFHAAKTNRRPFHILLLQKLLRPTSYSAGAPRASQTIRSRAAPRGTVVAAPRSG